MASSHLVDQALAAVRGVKTHEQLVVALQADIAHGGEEVMETLMELTTYPSNRSASQQVRQSDEGQRLRGNLRHALP